MSMDLLQLTVLGSATPYPRVDNACSGYLVSTGDTRIWVDAGAGTLAALQRYTRLEELDAIWISHMHADHSADLLVAYYAVRYADVRLAAPIPLFGPPGIADKLAHFLTNSEVRSPIESAFAIEELHDGHVTQVGPLALRSGAVAHGVPAFGLRIEASGRSLAYSGDTAPCAGLVGLAEGCDVLLCESGNAKPQDGDELEHHGPEEAGATADAAGAGRLIVTHVSPFLRPQHVGERRGPDLPLPGHGRL